MKSTLRRTAVVAPLRTGVGSFGGSLRPLSADQLATHIIKAVLERSGIESASIDEVIVAQSYASSEAPCLGRYAALAAGLPIEVPGYTVDRRCGSGLQAVIDASMMVQTHAADVVLVVGVESMSNIEYYSTDMRWGSRSGSVTFHDRFDEEVVSVPVPQKKGEPLIFAKDEGIRFDTSREALGRLRPVLKGGSVTAGNASQQNDASAACLIVAEDRLASLNLEPMAFLSGWAAAGCHPATMGIGPVPAVKKLFALTGLSFDQIDLVELNEAFAAQVLSVLKAWQWNDRERLNPNGGAIALGHPIGATGVRMLTTLLHELARRKGRYGLETMCIGGGQGLAALFERP